MDKKSDREDCDESNMNFYLVRFILLILAFYKIIKKYSASSTNTIHFSQKDNGWHGSYRQVCVKFKDFSRTSKRLSYCFQRLKTFEKYWFTC